MPPLEIERYNPEKNEWRKRGEVKPDAPQTMINLKPDGTKEIIFLESALNGLESSIKRMELGDKSFVQPNKMQVLHTEGDLVEIARLRTGGTFETTIQEIDQDYQPTRYRFRHK